MGAFLDHTAEDRLYAFFHVVGLLGLRRGEALGLRWTDVDLQAGVLRVAQQLVETSDGLRFGVPKTRSGIGAVPLDLETVHVLMRHRDRQIEEKAAWGAAWIGRGLVFTRENGEVLRP